MVKTNKSIEANMSYKGFAGFGVTVAGALVGGSLLLEYEDRRTGYPPRGTSALVFDLNRCQWDYGKIVEKWLEAEGQTSGPLELLRGSRIVRRYNPEGPTSTGMLALPDLDGNGMFGPTLDGCGAVIHNYNWERTPEQNLENLRRSPKEKRPTFLGRAPRSIIACLEENDGYRSRGNNYRAPQPQNHFRGRVIARTRKG